MASFVVMQPAGGSPGDPHLVKDGFTLLGFLFPPLWLLWHGLVVEAAVIFAGMFGIAAGAGALGLGPAGSLLSLLLSLYVGLEGPAMRVARLRRRGWQEAGVVEADNFDEADIRHAVATLLEDEAIPGSAEVRPALTPMPRLSVSPGGAPLGLLGYTGR